MSGSLRCGFEFPVSSETAKRSRRRHAGARNVRGSLRCGFELPVASETSRGTCRCHVPTVGLCGEVFSYVQGTYAYVVAAPQRG